MIAEEISGGSHFPLVKGKECQTVALCIGICPPSFKHFQKRKHGNYIYGSYISLKF